MFKFMFALLFVFAVSGQVLAQTSNVPAFPSDDAELVDPTLLDVTETTPTTDSNSSDSTSTSPSSDTTTTVPDSGTGTPTLPAVLAASALSFSAIFIWRIRRKLYDRPN